MSSFKMKESLRRFVKAHTASSQQVSFVLKTKGKSQSSEITATISAVKDGPVSSKAETEHFLQSLEGHTTVQVFCGLELRFCSAVLYTARKEILLPILLEWKSVFVQRFIRKESSRQGQSFAVRSDSTERFFVLSIYCVSGCLQEYRFHAKLPWKTGNRVVVAAQLVKTAWSGLLQSSGLRNVLTVYCSYFIHHSRRAILHFLALNSGGFSLCSQRESFEGKDAK